MARQMKDSGIEWIREIPKTWETVALKHLCTMQAGKNLVAEQIADEGAYPVYGGNGLRGYFSDFNTDGEYLLVGRQGALCGNVHQVSGQFWATEHAVVTKYSNLAYIRFLYYLLIGMNLNQYASNTAAQPGLSVSEIQNVRTCLAPYAEQHRIAAFLDRKCAEIDAVIERTKATIEEYKKLKQAVITEAVTKGVRGPRPMKDSGIEWLGSIPNAWDCTKLKQVWVSVDSGVSVNAADYPTENDTQYGVLKTSCVSKFVFLANEHKQVDAEEYARVACPVKKDTIIVSRMNTPDLVGACGYVDADYPNLFLPDRLWQISFFPEVSAKFVWYYLNNQMVRAYISSLSTGTSSSMQNISKPQFGGITLAVPPTIEQDEIVHFLAEKCAALDTIIAKKTALLTELETYKKSLIYEYVTGKKEVK